VQAKKELGVVTPTPKSHILQNTSLRSVIYAMKFHICGTCVLSIECNGRRMLSSLGQICNQEVEVKTLGVSFPSASIIAPSTSANSTTFTVPHKNEGYHII
jgi:hypothetical protein